MDTHADTGSQSMARSICSRNNKDLKEGQMVKHKELLTETRADNERS